MDGQRAKINEKSFGSQVYNSQKFEIDDPVETTFGNGVFVGYSNGGQTYKIRLIDGVNQGSELSFGEKAIKSNGRNGACARKTESKYAPYEVGETL